MITTQDITKLEKIFSTKLELEELRVDMNDGFHILTKQITHLSENVERLTVNMDYIVGKYKERDLEDHIGSMVQARHTRQIEAIAEYVQIELPE
jgi:hypothetical protein